MKKARIILKSLFFLLPVFPASAANITFTINPSVVAGPISPYIYGANSGITNVTNIVYRRAATA